MYERILVPLDGSELAEVALPYAEELAGRLGFEIRLIHVSESGEDRYRHMGQYYIQGMAETTKLGAESHLKRMGEKTIKVQSASPIGHPAEEIADYADRENIGLIVMATHGRSGIKRWPLGSVADKVARAAKQPVALIRARGGRPDVRRKGILQEALIPLDGSKESEAVIPYVEELASKLQAKVVLFQAVALAYHVYTSGDTAAQVPYTEEEMEPLKANAKVYLEKVESELKSKGIITGIEVRVGDAAEQIIKVADEINADLVAMSTHGGSGLSRWVFGSVADKVLHSGNTPLLLVRTPRSGAE